MADLYLDGVLAKLNRADAHLKALQAEIPAFFDRDPYSFREDLDCEAGQYSLHIEIREQPPLLWSVIAGDLVHNLRSALDHLAWQLVLVSNNKPSSNTQFPIFSVEPVNGRPLAKWKRMVAGMSGPILKCIRHVQPYTAGDQAQDTGLAILNSLSNMDKHRLPVARVAAVARHDPGSIGLIPVRDIEILDAEIFTERPLEDGDKIAWADVRCTGPQPEVDVKGPIPMHIAFRSGTNYVPMQGLVDIFEHTQVLVGLFESLCTAAP
jgi:hypothetical protein